VSRLDQFSISFSGLMTGMHHFEFEINDRFFENFEYSVIKSGQVHVDVELDRKEKMLTLLFSLKGKVKLECDRCLADYDQEIISSPQLILKLGKTRREETDEIESIPETSNEVNVAQYIYEYINLALPVKKVHPLNKKGEPGCDKIILEKLKEHQTGKQNNEEADPRWDALKNIKFN
jgi:uncharacterized protein